MKLLESDDLNPADITLGEDHAKHLDEGKIVRLLATLQAGGVLPPVVVDSRRQLVAGRNRFEAYGRAGLPVRADVVLFDDHLESMELAIRENLDRKRLTPAQEAEALAQLVWIEEQRDAAQAQGALAERQPRTKTDRVREVAEKTGSSQRKVERAVTRSEEARNPKPPPEPIVPPPAKPVPIERLIMEFADKLADLAREGDALLPKALAEPGQATGATWRGNLRNSIGQLSKECAVLRTVADDIRRARAALASNDFKAVEAARKEREKEAKRQERTAKKLADREARAQAPKTGLGGKSLNVVDENDRPLLPSEEDIKRSWDEGAATFGPDGEDPGEGAF